VTAPSLRLSRLPLSAARRPASPTRRHDRRHARPDARARISDRRQRRACLHANHTSTIFGLDARSWGERTSNEELGAARSGTPAIRRTGYPLPSLCGARRARQCVRRPTRSTAGGEACDSLSEPSGGCRASGPFGPPGAPERVGGAKRIPSFGEALAREGECGPWRRSRCHRVGFGACFHAKQLSDRGSWEGREMLEGISAQSAGAAARWTGSVGWISPGCLGKRVLLPE